MAFKHYYLFTLNSCLSFTKSLEIEVTFIVIYLQALLFKFTLPVILLQGNHPE